MFSETNAPRLLGAAYLFVLLASVFSGALLASVVGPGPIQDILANVAADLTLFRISILAELTTSTGIVALAVLLFIVLRRQNRIIATVALGLWLAEAITLAVSKIGSFGLIPLSQEFLAAGAPAGSHYLSLGDMLYFALDRAGYDIHMWFFGLGGMLWYGLFYASRLIPRPLALWGLISVVLAFAGIVLTMLGFAVNFLLFAQVALFELCLGLWLLLKGAARDITA